MEAMTEETRTLKSANSVSKVDETDCSGAYEADPAMVVIKFKGQQGVHSPDSKIDFSSSPADDSVMIIDSD